MFTRINKKYFNNELPTVEIVANPRKVSQIQGYLEYSDRRSQPKIIIYTVWNKDDEILAHEMIHLSQYISNMPTYHSQEFYDLEHKIVSWLGKKPKNNEIGNRRFKIK